jgi:hypothetical protein
MTARLQDMTLRHADPAKLMFQARHPAFPQDLETPEWYENASSGGVNLAPWLNGTVLAKMEAKFEKGAYFTVVSVMGVYVSDEQAEAAEKAELNNQVDSSTLDEATEEERIEFSKRVVEDLFPFLRAETYRLSGSLQGVFGVMLQPHPELNLPGAVGAAPKQDDKPR